jgi:threonine efflux protein
MRNFSEAGDSHVNDLSFMPAVLTFFVAAATPGPATLAVSSTAMSRGVRPALLLGIGLAVGLAFWGVIAAAGLGALLLHSSSALTALRWFGGAYLLYLAWQSARSAILRPTNAGDDLESSDLSLIARGLLLNASNPKAVLAWVSVLALGTTSSSESSELAITTGLCSALGLAIYVAYALAFSQPVIRAAYRASRRAVDGLAAAFFGYSGIKLIASRTDMP